MKSHFLQEAQQKIIENTMLLFFFIFAMKTDLIYQLMISYLEVKDARLC